MCMTDPKETTNDEQVQQHGAGLPNPAERDPDQGSDVGGPAGGVQNAAENAVDEQTSAGNTATDDQARNPL
jgi:hypothetical protein